MALVEIGALEAIRRDHQIELAAQETGRNPLTCGVPLNRMIGRAFREDEVALPGGRLNLPCAYLDKLPGEPPFGPLTNRSGLDGMIAKGGTITSPGRITLI